MPTAIVETPDGREMELEVPEGATEQQILNFAQQQFSQSQTQRQGPNPVASPPQGQRDAPGADITATEATSRQALESLLDNVSSLVGMFRPSGTGAPPLGQVVNLPSGEQVAAGVDAGLQAPGAMARGEPVQLGQRFDQSLQRSQQAEAERPLSTGVGDLLGQAATLATGRAPVARGIQNLERKIAERAPKEEILSLTPTGSRAAKRLLNSKSVKGLARGAGRSTEAGLEGATLALLTDGDPLEVGAFSAGGQGLGSAILSTTKELVSGGPMKAGAKLALAAGSTGALIQVMKSGTPGGKDFSLESLESGFDKVKWGLVLGGIAGAVGGGRIRSKEIGKEFPKITDFLQTTLQRGPMIAMINEWREDERIEPVLSEASENPEFFSAEQKRQLTRAVQKKDVSLSKTIDRLSKDPDFEARLDVLTRDAEASRSGQTSPETASSG